MSAKDRSQRPTPASGSPPVTVRADDFALLHLIEEAAPVAIRQGLPDVEGLRPGIDVVELQRHRVRLTAVGARMAFEVAQEVSGSLPRQCPLAIARIVDVAVAVREVVLAVVRRTAWAAQAVPLSALSTAPIEFLGWLQLTALSTPPVPRACHDEHMFVSWVDGSSPKLRGATGRGAVW